MDHIFELLLAWTAFGLLIAAAAGAVGIAIRASGKRDRSGFVARVSNGVIWH